MTQKQMFFFWGRGLSESQVPFEGIFVIAMPNYYTQNGKFCLQSKVLCSLKQSIGQQCVTNALK